MEKQVISIEDLRKVKGIGLKAIERIKEQLEINEEEANYISEYDKDIHLDLNEIHLGDCLELTNGIPDGSVDLILTDLPYGNMRGAQLDGWVNQTTEWDNIINPSDVFDIANRILRRNGKMVLFSQEPYTTNLVSSSVPNVPFNYRMVWKKDHFANSLIAKKAPVSYFEDILVFSKQHDFEGLHPLREYFRQVLEFVGLPLGGINRKLGHRRAEHSFYITSSQFSLCTEETYSELIVVFEIDEMAEFKCYQELRELDKAFDATFNLWEGNKYKSNVLEYKKDYDGYHPTQKPVLLLEDLIKTFSNAGDLVVDLTAGSGSTAVAAVNTKRDFIAIEMDEEYHRIATERVANHVKE